MIAITFALPAESSDFLRRLPREADEVCIWHTGVGAALARARIEEKLSNQSPPPQCLIAAGFAGALEDRFEVGDLLLAENFSDPELLLTARRALGSVRVGKLISAEVVLDSANERRALAKKSGANAVDMETEVIAELCRKTGVPLLSLRAITDTPAAPFPLPPEILFNVARQKTEMPRLLAHLARHPRAVGKLISFSGRIARARRSLGAALELVLREISR